MDPITFALSATAAKWLWTTAYEFLQKNAATTEALENKERIQPNKKTSHGGKKAEDATHEIVPVFGRYVTRSKEFAQELIRVRAMIQDYASRTRVARPMNILLAAEPGNGKSFLIKELAKSISTPADVVFEEFYVAAFRSIDDLLGVFQRIQSANLHGKLPFVLLDEVDAKVDGRHLLANLLAPMWDGIFHTGKDSFALGKAVLCFAASSMVPAPTVENVLEESSSNTTQQVKYADFARRWQGKVVEKINRTRDQANGIEKSRDFMDRVDYLVCIPPVHRCLLGDHAAKEQVDLACILVQKHFPGVHRIELSAVGALIKKLTESSSRRAAEKAVFGSSSPPADTFRFVDLPGRDQEQYKEDSEIKLLMDSYIRITVKKPA
jgi:hypothetical protein